MPPILAAFRDPLPPRAALLVAVAIIGANTLYCLAYSALAGRGETVAEGIGWSVVNILPWLVAFEAGKRSRRPALAVAAALALSLALGLLIGRFQGVGFELVRRLPGAALTLAALWLAARARARAAPAPAPGALPLLPQQIAWVAAAGNYVELHGAGRPVLHRAPLSAVAAALAPSGFVRIHRSILVDRRRIARVGRDDVLLDDGTSLKLGKRYRAELGG